MKKYLFIKSSFSFFLLFFIMSVSAFPTHSKAFASEKKVLPIKVSISEKHKHSSPKTKKANIHLKSESVKKKDTFDSEKFSLRVCSIKRNLVRCK